MASAEAGPEPETPPQGIPAAEAQRLVLEAASLLPPERVAAEAALGRVLAEPVESGRTLPPADVSAMDGYALRAADAGRAEGLPVVFEARAGGPAPRALGEGEAARIFTGAPLPPGADSVLRQEDARLEDGRLRPQTRVALGTHVRAAGEDVRAGEAVLAPGTVLRAGHLGLLASLGRTGVCVRARPRVAILSGGDELVYPDGPAEGGRIVASNGESLAAQCREAGAEPVPLGIARDDPEELVEHLRRGLRADAIVSSAGVSVGDHDHVRPALRALGAEIVFWGVRIRPGFPAVFARLGGEAGAAGPLLFGLPGNPVSAMVTFEQLVRPALLRMAGRTRLFRPVVRARLAEALPKQPGRLHLVRVHLERTEDGRFVARTTGSQSSGVLRSMALADGLAVLPAESGGLEAGAEVRVQVLDPSAFDEERSPL